MIKKYSSPLTVVIYLALMVATAFLAFETTNRVLTPPPTQPAFNDTQEIKQDLNIIRDDLDIILEALNQQNDQLKELL